MNTKELDKSILFTTILVTEILIDQNLIVNILNKSCPLSSISSIEGTLRLTKYEMCMFQL